jgi:hypothetical protein
MSAPRDVLAMLDERIAVERAGMVRPAKLIAIREVAAELIRLVKAIDEECSNAKPNFGRVVKLASEAAALARVGGAT